MKNQNLFAALIITLIAVSQSQAEVISVNINGWNGNPMAQTSDVTGVAGVEAVGNWNNAGAVAGTNTNVNNSGTLAGLLNDSGAVTSASYTWQFNNYWGNPSGSLTTQDNALFRGYADTDGAGGNNSGITTMRVDSLTSNFTNNGYDVLVYVGGDSNHNSPISITGTDNMGNTVTEYLIQNDNSLNAGDSFVESDAQIVGDAVLANYVRLSGFTGSTIDLSFNDLAGGRARPVGFQIVSNLPVPEPGSMLVWGALAAVLSLVRFRRAKK